MEQAVDTKKIEWLYKDEEFAVSNCPCCKDYLVTIFTPSCLVDFLTICKVFKKLCDIFDCSLCLDFKIEFESNFFTFHVFKMETAKDITQMGDMIKLYKQTTFKKYGKNISKEKVECQK